MVDEIRDAVTVYVSEGKFLFDVSIDGDWMRVMAFLGLGVANGRVIAAWRTGIRAASWSAGIGVPLHKGRQLQCRGAKAPVSALQVDGRPFNAVDETIAIHFVETAILGHLVDKPALGGLVDDAFGKRPSPQSDPTLPRVERRKRYA